MIVGVNGGNLWVQMGVLGQEDMGGRKNEVKGDTDRRVGTRAAVSTRVVCADNGDFLCAECYPD